MQHPDFSDAAIEQTARRIMPHLRRTPVFEARLSGIGPVQFKAEYLQHTGSFKARGAFSALTSVTPGPAGVAAASGGNHGAAVAYAARQFGVKARIFVPATAPEAKVARIRSYGAEIDQTGSTYQHALEACAEYCRVEGARSLHAYDQAETILGQATLGRELHGQSPGLDTVLVATGGGGLISGIASWYRNRARIISVEPRTCATLHDALAHGASATVSPQGIAADALGASRAGDLVLPIARTMVSSAILVDDADIIAAMRWLWQQARVMVEPGGATALAALLSGAYVPARGERIGVVLCGANIEPIRFAELIGH